MKKKITSWGWQNFKHIRAYHLRKIVRLLIGQRNFEHKLARSALIELFNRRPYYQGQLLASDGKHSFDFDAWVNRYALDEALDRIVELELELRAKQDVKKDGYRGGFLVSHLDELKLRQRILGPLTN